MCRREYVSVGVNVDDSMKVYICSLCDSLIMGE